MLLFTALSVAAIALAVVLALTIWRLRKTIEIMERRVDDAIRQFEMTAEDLRKTNAVVREILQHAERSAANVAHVTEGVRGFRRTLDAATAVMEFAALPVFKTAASGLAGVKAALSTVVNRFARKESDHV